MDEDISLEGFDSTIFMKIWSCAFKQRPLIVQPLVVESNQFLVYVNEKPWREAPWDDVDASRVGYIEQQVPLFDSIFFEWFVKRVLSQTKQWSMEYGIDWGHDRSWCNAAHMYARFVLHWPIVSNGTQGQAPRTDPPCALITQQGTGVHHLDGKTMSIIHPTPRTHTTHTTRTHPGAGTENPPPAPVALETESQFSAEYAIDWGFNVSLDATKMKPQKHEKGDRAAKDAKMAHAAMKKNGFYVVQKYAQLFPTWVSIILSEPNNPLSAANAHKFEQVRALKGCVR